LNDLDNVLYEISGDAPSSSREWQYHMIKLLEKTTVKAMALKSGSNPSAQATATFTIVAPRASLL
jgi:hypothetical protein